MTIMPTAKLVADPTRLSATAAAPAADLARAQAALAAPPAGQIAVLRSPLSATVQNPLGEPDQVRGMKAAEQLGPFTDPNGLGHGIIILNITTSEQFAFGSAASPFGVMPIVNVPASGTQFTLGAGSVWFETNMLAPAAAAGGFSGFLISAGTLTASNTITLQGGTYVAPAGTTLAMTATLAPPAPGTGSPGADLTNAEIALPTTVTIVFTQTAATITALANSSVTLYGTPVGLTWNKATPQPLTNIGAVLVPCTASVSSFPFSNVASALFGPAGTAAINAVGWALPVAVTTIGALGNPSGAGSLVLELGAGASLTCAGRPSSAPIGGWLITINPAQLFVLGGGIGAASSTHYSLWPAEPARHGRQHHHMVEPGRVPGKPHGDVGTRIGRNIRQRRGFSRPAACGRWWRVADGWQRHSVCFDGYDRRHFAVHSGASRSGPHTNLLCRPGKCLGRREGAGHFRRQRRPAKRCRDAIYQPLRKHHFRRALAVAHTARPLRCKLRSWIDHRPWRPRISRCHLELGRRIVCRRLYGLDHARGAISGRHFEPADPPGRDADSAGSLDKR